MDNFEQDIINILFHAGDGGYKLSDISRRVYNDHCSLFSATNIDDVTSQVRRDITRLVRRNIVITTSKRGYYAINNNSSMFMQMQFVFSDNEEDVLPESSSSTQEDSEMELSLF